MDSIIQSFIVECLSTCEARQLSCSWRTQHKFCLNDESFDPSCGVYPLAAGAFSGDFLELESHFLRQIEQLAHVGDAEKTGVKVHPLSLLSNELLSDTQLITSVDKEVSQFRTKLDNARSAHYKLPLDLTAELRPYQEEGFRWLARLADLEAGACLADDMGLGKTIQCIALMIHRAEAGPTLVVAPASVGPNWISEINRSSTGLEPILFGDGDRASFW